MRARRAAPGRGSGAPRRAARRPGRPRPRRRAPAGRAARRAPRTAASAGAPSSDARPSETSPRAEAEARSTRGSISTAATNAGSSAPGSTTAATFPAISATSSSASRPLSRSTAASSSRHAGSGSSARSLTHSSSSGERRAARSPGRCAASLRPSDSHQRARQPRTQVRAERDLGQQVAAQRGRPAAGRRVVLVHQLVGAPPESRRRRTATAGRWSPRRRRCGPSATSSRTRRERLEVELVGQAGAPRLEHEREVVELPHRVEQLLGALPRQPQRGAAAEPLAGQQQRDAGRLAEAGAEEPGALERRAQQLLAPRRPRTRASSSSGRTSTGGASDTQSSSWMTSRVPP